MPFANINFSELIKAAISLFPPPSSFRLSITVFLEFTRTTTSTRSTSRHRYRRRRQRLLVGITWPRNACGYTLPPTRYMLAVMLLASCVDPRAKLAFSWLPWPSWYSAGIGIKTSSFSATCVTIPRSLPPIAALALVSLSLSLSRLINFVRLSFSLWRMPRVNALSPSLAPSHSSPE